MWKQANVTEHIPGSYDETFTLRILQKATPHQAFEKKPLKCEVSITDTEVSGWVVNSLKPFFSEKQTILGSAVQCRLIQMVTGMFQGSTPVTQMISMARKEGTSLLEIVWAFLG